MRIAKVKLQHDLYDRRYAIFQSARRLLDETAANKVVSADTLRQFVIGTADAEFLLPDDLAAYLAELSCRARKAQSIYMVMLSLPEGCQDWQNASLAANGETGWLVEQIDGLTAKFRDVLKLDKHSRSPLGWLW